MLFVGNFRSCTRFIKTINLIQCTQNHYLKTCRWHCSRKQPDVSDIPELNEPPFKKFYEAYFAEATGKVYDKRPFRVKCTAGKIYYWCPCGQSHDQPFCDGRCRYPEMAIKLRPTVFKPRQTREYWFCNCKQTKNRPFCDGTHNTEAVQSAQSFIRRKE